LRHLKGGTYTGTSILVKVQVRHQIPVETANLPFIKGLNFTEYALNAVLHLMAIYPGEDITNNAYILIT
jgi:hypothetical protein